MMVGRDPSTQGFDCAPNDRAGIDIDGICWGSCLEAGTGDG
jgi:hypothetical protein